MKRKRLMIVLAALVLSIGTVGCGNNETNTGSNTQEEVKEDTKEKEKENPSAPLDKQDEKAHNVSESKDTSGAKRGPGRPRKKGGSTKKDPAPKKGEPNEN